MLRLFFFFNDTAPTEIYTLSLHDALPISGRGSAAARHDEPRRGVLYSAERSAGQPREPVLLQPQPLQPEDRKSTRLNSSHLVISYAVFCLKKKKIMIESII